MKRLLLGLVLIVASALPVRGQGTTMPNPLIAWTDNSGLVLGEGGLCVFVAGTSTLATTYTTATAGVANANPVLFDSAGRPASQGVFLIPGSSYKFVLKDFTGVVSPTCIPDTGVTLWSVDNIAANSLPPSSTGTAGENLGPNTPVYLSHGDGGRTAGRWYLTDADLNYASTTANETGWVATAIASGSTGIIQFTGIVTTSGAVLPGVTYYASATAGAITNTAPVNQRIVGVTNSTSTLVLGTVPTWTATAMPLTTANQPTGANAGAGAIIQRTDGIRGLWGSTGTNFYALNGAVLSFGAFDGIGDNTTDNDTAFDAAVAAIPSGGGVLSLPAGTFFTSDLITLTTDYTIIRGQGVGLTTIRSTDTTGAIKFACRFCGLENLTVLYEGAGSYGVLFYNGSAVPKAGADRATVTNVKIKGTSTTGNGLLLQNSIHGTFTNLYLPCGGASAIQLEGSAFNTFTDTQITTNLNESCAGAAWIDGLTLQKQTGNDAQQSDDNKFVNLIVEGVTRHGVYITSKVVTGQPPSRNSFIGGTSEGNLNDVVIDNGSANTFYGFHVETATKFFWIVGNDGNDANSFYGCFGVLDIDNPPTAQGIQATTIVGHVGNIEISGSKVFGTQIYAATGTIADSGTNTTSFRSSLAVSPGAATVYTFNGRTFTNGPNLPTNTVQGSGGAAVTIIALPASTYGDVYVKGTQTGTTNFAYYRIPYVNGTGVALGTPVTALAGGTQAQMVFTLSGSNLQAKGANATAPDLVMIWIDSFPVP